MVTRKNTNNRNGPPKVNVHKRRLSQPTTLSEKTNAIKTHEMNNIQQKSVNNVKNCNSATNNLLKPKDCVKTIAKVS